MCSHLKATNGELLVFLFLFSCSPSVQQTCTKHFNVIHKTHFIYFNWSLINKEQWPHLKPFSNYFKNVSSAGSVLPDLYS